MTKLIARSQLKSTCPYCGVGCGVSVNQAKNTLVIDGDHDHPANQGHLCVKGSNLKETQDYSNRVTSAELHGQPVTVDAALNHVADQFHQIIKQHGPDAIAFYLSGQLLTEDYYVANKLMKGFIGSGNVDTNSRLCMASAVAAQKRAFGEDVVPCNYDDIDHANLIVLAGSNMAWTHPIVYKRVVNAKNNRGARVVVIDPRETATTEIADLHLPVNIGSDVSVFNGLLKYLVDRDRLAKAFIDRHTRGFADCLVSADIPLAQVALETGIASETLNQFYEWFSTTENTVTIFSQGINQSAQGTDKANSIINCHLATGRIGKRGMGPFSITGQPNAMGGREVGGMANQLAAHMDFDTTSIKAVEQFWRAPSIAKSAGHKAVDMFQAVRRGEVKAIWIMGTNPAVSLPNTNEVKEALSHCPLVIVSEVTHQSDTAKYADVLLPAAGWGEKNGTVTNSERCVSRQRAFVQPPGDARADWQLICGLAAKLGFEESFQYESPHLIYREHAKLSTIQNQNGERQFDLGHHANINALEYEDLEPFQWSERPFADARFSTHDGRARFVSVSAEPTALEVRQQFILNSGRYRDQWHTMTRTGNSHRLFQHRALPTIDIHPKDAAQFDCEDQQLVSLWNSIGEYIGMLRVTPEVKRGELFAPIHWNDHFASSGSISRLYGDARDPISGQPASKQTVVQLAPKTTGRWGLLETQAQINQALAHDSIEYWIRVAGENRSQQYLFAWADESDELEQHIRRHFHADTIVSFSDSEVQIKRLMGGSEQKTSWRLQIAPTFAELWFSAGLNQSNDYQSLSPLQNGPLDRSPTICSCFDVKQSAITQALEGGASNTVALGNLLKCGTNCGSCIPELERIIRERQESLEDSRQNTLNTQEIVINA